MENEENRGLNDKKAYEYQFIDFASSFLELSLFSLYHTLAHLDFSWSTIALDQGNKRKDKEGKGKQRSSKDE